MNSSGQRFQLGHKTLNLFRGAVSPGQRQVGRNRLPICNTNNLSEQMEADDSDAKFYLGRTSKKMRRPCLCVTVEEPVRFHAAHLGRTGRCASWQRL